MSAWQRKAGKNPKGGLNEKGRRSYERENPGSNLKAPVKKGDNPRRARVTVKYRDFPQPRARPKDVQCSVFVFGARCDHFAKAFEHQKNSTWRVRFLEHGRVRLRQAERLAHALARHLHQPKLGDAKHVGFCAVLT